MILKDRIIRANIPSGCDAKDERTSPRNKNEIEVPRPQPGQKANPMFFTGHNE